MKQKNIWQLVIVMALLVFAFPVAPEITMVVALIDVIGLDLLLLLFEIQVVVAIGAVYRQRIMPVLVWINARLEDLDPYYFVPRRDQIKNCPAAMIHSVPYLVGVTFFTLAVMSVYA